MKCRKAGWETLYQLGRQSVNPAWEGVPAAAPCSAPRVQVLGQPKFITLPTLFLRHEICSKLGDGSM